MHLKSTKPNLHLSVFLCKHGDHHTEDAGLVSQSAVNTWLLSVYMLSTV